MERRNTPGLTRAFVEMILHGVIAWLSRDWRFFPAKRQSTATNLRRAAPARR